MNLNRIILIGRMVNDPEAKYTPSGIPVTTFRIAVNRPLSAEARQQGTEQQADFISIVAWRQNAEYAANYLSKGRLIAIEGKLQIREYVTQDGQKRSAAEVVADNVKALDKREGGEEGGGGASGGGGGYAEARSAGGGGYDRNNGGGGYGGRGASGGGYSNGGDSDDEAAAPAPARAAAPAARPAAAPPARGGRSAAPPPSDDFDDMSDLSDPFAE